MGSNLQMVLRSFGIVFLSFGLTASIIECLSQTYGEGHPTAVMFAVVSLAAGAVLFGAGTVLHRRGG